VTRAGCSTPSERIDDRVRGERHGARASFPELAVLTVDDRIRRNSAQLGFDVLPAALAG
jgi:hypothetical protein